MSQVQGREIEPDGTRPVMTADERAELERLRLENAELRSRPRPPTRRIRWRSVFAVVLLVLGCALAPVALVATWARDELSNTDRFVQTVRPLVADPAVQGALTNRITTTIFEHVDVQALANDAITALAAQGLPPPIVQRLEVFTPSLATATTGFVRDKVGQVVASPQFAAAWDQAVRVAHQQAVTVLSGNSQSVVVRGDTVYLDLAPFIDVAKQRLSADGITAVNLVPEVHPTIAITPADQLVRAQTAYNVLGSLATVLPWISLLLLAVGVYLARVRMRAVIGAALGVAVALVVLAAALLVVRGLLVSAVPQAGAPAAASAFDIIVRFLRDSGRALIVLALVVALGAFLAGSSATAVGIRRWATGLLHRIRGGPSATGPVSTWVRPRIRGLRIAAVAVAALVFVFLDRPTGVTIVAIAAGLLVVLGLIEFLGRGEEPAAAPAPPPAVG
ncbi:hypothetical protein GCM10009609_39000 [Pseudonocardia aurantiaca]|uniref:Integral membrane protein n=1 Tax=Pseudonocardia aurantiaca TaxID=75290 RepID=A0ABW4FN09_9PSEU